MTVVIDTIHSGNTATNKAHQSQLEPETTPRKVSTFVHPQLVANCHLDLHFHNARNMVQFSGLYVVRGPTASKHMRYTMDITVTEVQLRARCIQRFQNFFLLRKRLLKILKSCRGRLPAGKGPLNEMSAGTELVELLTRPRCVQCRECESMYHQISSVKFPHRTLLSPSLQDVQERSQLLETFLDYCMRYAITWSACQRSKTMVVTTLGAFLGMDLTTHLANQKEVGVVSVARTVVCVSDDLIKAETNPGVVPLPSPQDEMEHAVEFPEDRHSEPEFIFEPKPSKKNNMVRSQSHR